VSPLPRPDVAQQAKHTCHATDHRIAGSPAARVRAPGGLIDEVGATMTNDEAHQASRLPHSIKNYLKDSLAAVLQPCLRLMQAARGPVGCRRGDSAGERVPYDLG